MTLEKAMAHSVAYFGRSVRLHMENVTYLVSLYTYTGVYLSIWQRMMSGKRVGEFMLPSFGLFIYFHLACRQYFASVRQYYLFRLTLQYIRYTRA